MQALAQIYKGLMASHATPDDDPIPEALVKQSVLSRYESIDSTRQASTKKMGRHGQRMDGNVQELNISDNPVGMLGIKAVGELLNPAFNPVQRLTQLILNKCDIPDFAGMVLAQALHKNTTLADLQISGNQLSDVAATAFGKMLQMNSTLEKLDLSWNNIKVGTPLAAVCHLVQVSYQQRSTCTSKWHKRSCCLVQIVFWRSLIAAAGTMFVG